MATRGAQASLTTRNMFVDTVQEEMGRDYLRELTTQLHQTLKVDVTDEAKKRYDTEGGR